MKHVVLIFIFSLSYKSILACSCTYYIDLFCHSVEINSHVALCVITGIEDDHSVMNLNVIENINESILEDSISVLAQDGFNCGLFLDDFNVGDSLVVNINNETWLNTVTGDSLDWYINGCERRYLRYSENQVFGGIVNDMVVQDYNEFKSGILGCVQFVSNNTEIINDEIEIYPNPVSGVLTMKYSNLTFNSVKLFEMDGKLVIERFGKNNTKFDLEMSGLLNGIYFLVIETDAGIIRRKIIKL